MVQWARIERSGPFSGQLWERWTLQRGTKELTAVLIHKTMLGEEKLHCEEKTKKKVLVGTEGVPVPLL